MTPDEAQSIRDQIARQTAEQALYDDAIAKQAFGWTDAQVDALFAEADAV